jgi:hypothetical protein
MENGSEPAELKSLKAELRALAEGHLSIGNGSARVLARTASLADRCAHVAAGARSASGRSRQVRR